MAKDKEVIQLTANGKLRMTLTGDQFLEFDNVLYMYVVQDSLPSKSDYDKLIHAILFELYMRINRGLRFVKDSNIVTLTRVEAMALSTFYSKLLASHDAQYIPGTAYLYPRLHKKLC